MKTEREKFITDLGPAGTEAARGFFEDGKSLYDILKQRRISLRLRYTHRDWIGVAAQALSAIQQTFEDGSSPARKRVEYDIVATRPSQNISSYKRFREHREIWADRMKAMALHYAALSLFT